MRSLKWFIIVLVAVVAGCQTDVENTIYNPGSPTGPVGPTVVPVNGISVSPSVINLSAGASCTNTSAQLVITVSPSNATNREWSIRSTNHAVAGFSVSGVVSALKAGADTLTIVSAGDSTKRATVVVNVSGTSCVQTVAVTGVTVSPTSFNLSVGNGCTNTSQKLSVTVSPSNATDTTYSVSITNHGSVTLSGLSFTAKQAGVDTISIVSKSDSTKRATSVVTVSGTACVLSITLLPNGGNGIKGSTAQDTAKVDAPAGVSTKVIWYSTDPTIVDVAQKDGDNIVASGVTILTNVKGGTLYFAKIGSATICAQSVADPTIRACAVWTTK